MNELSHFPVMVDEVVSYICPKNGHSYLDATFGQGGYTGGIFKKASDAKVIAVDQDLDSKTFINNFDEKLGKNFFFFSNKFSEIDSILEKIDVELFDGIVMDLGMSNTQLNNPSRGFSFDRDGPLDMRMDTKRNKLTTEIIINEYPEKELSDIFYYYGEERNSRKIARTITNIRIKKHIKTTSDLCNIIKKINFDKKKNPSTRVFQALRIFINDELGELELFLKKSLNILNYKGRIAVVAFHSLEDKIIKNFFKKMSDVPNGLNIITKKPLVPSSKEIQMNPRSRTAKLRIAEKK